MKARIPGTGIRPGTSTDLYGPGAMTRLQRAQAHWSWWSGQLCCQAVYSSISQCSYFLPSPWPYSLTVRLMWFPHTAVAVVFLTSSGFGWLGTSEQKTERERERNEGRCVATQRGGERRRHETSRSLLSVGSVGAERTGAERRARSPHHTAHHQLARTLARNNSKFEARWRPQRRRPHPRTSRSPRAKRSSWPSNPRCPTSSWCPSSTAPSASRVRSSTPPRGKIEEGKEWMRERTRGSISLSFFFLLSPFVQWESLSEFLLSK